MAKSQSPTKRAPRKRAYHHGDLVAALVDEGVRAVEKDGHEALSVREIARAVGVSAAAPFRHFADRDDLLRAVAFAGLRRYVADANRAAAEAGDEPLAQFRALGLTEVRFAIRHPNLLRLMRLPAMRKPPTTATAEDLALAKEAHARSKALVAAAQGTGTMRKGDAHVLELAGVALAFGLSQMFLDGILPREGNEPLAEAVLDVIGTGFRPDR